MMRILGVDPGSRKAGFGVIDCSGNRMIHVAHGVLRLDVTRDIGARLRQLAEGIRDVVAEHKPQLAVLEEVFMSESARSALLLGQARGAVLATLGLSGLTTFGLSTTTVKLAITGSGRASKTQIGEMVRHVLKLEKKPAEDAADALALAICQGQRAFSQISLETREPKRLSTAQKRQALAALARSQGITLP